MRYGGPTVTDTLTYLDTARHQSEALKARSFEGLRLEAGQRVLDVGCGTGDDVHDLAVLVAPTGEAVGLDNDPDLLAEARRRAVGREALTFVAGNAEALPFDDATFDACRAERVLQHLAHPERAVGEMRRVLRPGGRLVLLDVDWDTLVVTAGTDLLDVTRRLVQYGTDRHASGTIGRRLYALLRTHRFKSISCEPFVSWTTDWTVANCLMGFDWWTREACRAGSITPAERTRWLHAIFQQAEEGTFYSAITFTLATGFKP